MDPDSDSAALKFFRSSVTLQDENYLVHFAQKKHLGLILNNIYETMPRDNLLNSACLEFFEFIKREGLKSLIEHLVSTYRPQLQEITYVDTFQTLITRYEQMKHSPETDMTLFSNDGTPTPNRTPNLNGNRWQGVREMDAAEEAYFNTSDDEDEISSTKKSKVAGAPLLNGLAASPMLKSLVDYPDDDDDMDEPPHVASHLAKLAPSPVLQTPPPERLSEKRRREEDNDEDELGKLTVTKRRNSASSAASSVSTQGNNSLRRRKGFLGKERDSPTGGGGEKKKIEISFGAKTAVSEADAKQDDGG